MELTGRLVGDAEVKRTTDNRQLVAFTVAVNDYYTIRSGEKNTGRNRTYQNATERTNS